MSLLGIDVGTSGCKAAVFSEEGQQLALAYEEYDYQHPRPGWAELDSLQVWASVQRTIAQVARQTPHDPIKALSVSSLGEDAVDGVGGHHFAHVADMNLPRWCDAGIHHMASTTLVDDVVGEEIRPVSCLRCCGHR